MSLETIVCLDYSIFAGKWKGVVSLFSVLFSPFFVLWFGVFLFSFSSGGGIFLSGCRAAEGGGPLRCGGGGLQGGFFSV